MRLTKGSPSIFQTWVDSATAFDAAHLAILSRTLDEIEFIAPLALLVTLNVQLGEIESFTHKLALINRAKDSMKTSLQLIRHGALPDALAIMRVAVESIATAVHIAVSEEALDQYCGRSKRRYEATRSIGPAGKQIPHLALIYGKLSELAIHPNVGSFGPRRGGDGTMTIELDGHKADALQITAALAILRLIASMNFRACELVFFEPDEESNSWLCFRGGGTHAVLAVGARRIEQRFSELGEIPTQHGSPS